MMSQKKIEEWINRLRVDVGGMIERGSNSNGEYVKYADGTMICTYNGSFTWSNEVLIGSFYRYIGYWTFPSAFSTDLPTVVGQGEALVGGLLAMSSVTYYQQTSSVTEARIYLYVDGAAEDFLTESVIAVGRWY